MIQFLHAVQNLIAAARIEARGRLIQHKHLRSHREDTRNRDAALLAAREFKRRLLVKALRKPDHSERLSCALLDFVLRESHVLRTETHVLKHIDLKELMFRVLKHEPHLGAERAHVVPLRVNILAVDKELARRRANQTVQMLDQCGFSGAGVPDEPHKLTVRNIKAHIAECRLRKGSPSSVGIAQVFCADSQNLVLLPKRQYSFRKFLHREDTVR